jgi:hypothetical protein
MDYWPDALVASVYVAWFFVVMWWQIRPGTSAYIDLC